MRPEIFDINEYIDQCVRHAIEEYGYMFAFLRVDENPEKQRFDS